MDNIMVNKEMVASHYAKKTSRKLTKMLGKGQFGEAYLMDDGHVVKVTGDACEALASAYMVNEPHGAVVGVSNVKHIRDGIYVIEQERLDHNLETNGKCDEIYWALSNAADHAGYDMSEMFSELSLSEIIMYVADPEACEAAQQIKSATEHFINKGMEGDVVDLGSDNFGFNEEGRIVIFDLRVSGMSQSRAKETLRDEFSEVFANPYPSVEEGPNDMHPV